MRVALEAARRAAAAGDVPVGAALVEGDRLLALGENRRERDQDPTAHAEVVALRGAATLRRRWHLEGTTLYVTLEPCPMCAGALVLARVDALVYAAADPRAGAVRTLWRIADDPRLNHRLEVRGGVLEAEAAELLRAFFRERR
ncbi:MAG: nucleoside deaminase [Clostridia bacterium]|nr:nucleoside deaminase [Clostridia bacterium]MCL6522088.1 nucleoside deaminase [Bacillota bacterium]